MTCTRLPSPPGTTVIVCHKGARGRTCEACGRTVASKLCDGVLVAPGGAQRVCSAPLCSGCTIVGGPELDWCPRCAAGRPEGGGAVVVFTARVSYRRRDALDVTRKSGEGDGLAFAPSWNILNPALDARRRAAECLADGSSRDGAVGAYVRGCAQKILDEAWALYVPAFVGEMRESHGRPRTAPWRRLLARRCVTLCCYCTDEARCHRTILAAEILPKCGATYGGERGLT